jgi:YD repeat-containing protein
VLGTIDPLGNVQSMTYDTLGNVLLVGEVNAAGQNSLTAYDSAGNILSSFNVPGQILSTAYDADGNAVWIAVNVPEPTTASAIAVALLTAWRRPRRAPGRESAI